MKTNKMLKQIAKRNGYENEIELLWDYGVLPTVRMPKHKKIELVPLLWQYLKQKFTMKRPQ